MENYSKETEEALLGFVLSNPKEMNEALMNLKREYFYFEINQVIYDSILETFKNSAPIDIVSISNNLEEKKKLEHIGGSSFLANLISKCTIVSNPKHHCNILKDKYETRKFKEILQTYLDKIENKKYNSIKDLLSEISKDTFQISNNSTDEDTSIKYAIDQFTLKQEKYEERFNSGEEYLGTATGIKSLDKLIEGLQPEHLITLSAFTSCGKTTMAMNIVKNLLNRDKRVCIFSLEMSKVDLIGKLLALETGIPTVRLIKGLRDDVVYAEQKLAKENLLSKKLIIYSEISNVEDIVLAMQSEMTKDKVDLFVIDYIQNITGAININEYQLMTYAIKLLQQVNRQLKSTLLMLSQVSNETIKSTETFNIQGKNSGSIRHASDVFIYLKRDATEDDLTEIYNNGSDVPLKCIVNKNRHGRIGSFSLNLKQKTGEMFEPL